MEDSKNPRTPMQITDNPPELDTSPELGLSDIPLYQEMIGIHQWATELGSIHFIPVSSFPKGWTYAETTADIWLP